MHQLLIDYKKAFWFSLEGGLTNEFHIHMKPVTLIKMSLNENKCRFRIGQHLPDIKNGLKRGDALVLLVFIFAVEYAIKRVQGHHEVLKLRGTHQLMVYADGDNLLGRSIHTIKTQKSYWFPARKLLSK